MVIVVVFSDARLWCAFVVFVFVFRLWKWFWRSRWIGTREWRSRERTRRLMRMRFGLRAREGCATISPMPWACFKYFSAYVLFSLYTVVLLSCLWIVLFGFCKNPRLVWLLWELCRLCVFTGFRTIFQFYCLNLLLVSVWNAWELFGLGFSDVFVFVIENGSWISMTQVKTMFRGFEKVHWLSKIA